MDGLGTDLFTVYNEIADYDNVDLKLLDINFLSSHIERVYLDPVEAAKST